MCAITYSQQKSKCEVMVLCNEPLTPTMWNYIFPGTRLGITFAEGSRDESDCSMCVFESYLPKGILGREGKE